MKKMIAVIAFGLLCGCATYTPDLAERNDHVMSRQEAAYYQVPVCAGMTVAKCWDVGDAEEANQ